MSNSNFVARGYHGTTVEAATKIKRDNNFEKEDSGIPTRFLFDMDDRHNTSCICEFVASNHHSKYIMEVPNRSK